MILFVNLLFAFCLTTYVNAQTCYITDFNTINATDSLLYITSAKVTECSKLNLYRQNIIGIHEDAFQGMKHVLQDIFLYENQMTAIEPTLFANLNLVKRVYVDENNITALPGSLFSDMPALTFVKADYNQISYLEENLFSGLNVLRIVYLDHNLIEGAHSSVFTDATAMTYLRLDSNKISTLDDELFKTNTGLKTLKLEDNTGMALNKAFFENIDMESLTTFQIDQASTPPGLIWIYNPLKPTLNEFENCPPFTSCTFGIDNGICQSPNSKMNFTTYTCIPCPEGSFCRNGIEWSCNSQGQCKEVCKAGHVCDFGVETVCDDGKTTDAWQIECIDCPSGYTCAKGISTPCEAGYLCNATHAFSQCESGKVPNDLALECIDCPSGKICESGIANACPGGHYCTDSIDRGMCTNGQVSASDGASCIDCPENAVCADGLASACPDDHYCLDGADMGECLEGFYVNSNQTGCVAETSSGYAGSSNSNGIIIGCVVAVVCILLLAGLALLYYRRKSKKEKDLLGGLTPEQFANNVAPDGEIELQTDEEYENAANAHGRYGTGIIPIHSSYAIDSYPNNDYAKNVKNTKIPDEKSLPHQPSKKRRKKNKKKDNDYITNVNANASGGEFIPAVTQATEYDNCNNAPIVYDNVGSYTSEYTVTEIASLRGNDSDVESDNGKNKPLEPNADEGGAPLFDPADGYDPSESQEELPNPTYL